MKYMLATRLSHDYLMELIRNPELGNLWLEKIKTKCPEVEFHAHYFVLGPYDFLDVFTAPDAECAARVSLITQQMGAVNAQTWRVSDYQDFKNILKSIQ